MEDLTIVQMIEKLYTSEKDNKEMADYVAKKILELNKETIELIMTSLRCGHHNQNHHN